MPGETGSSPETVAALPEPAVGVEYPSGEAAKLAVLRAFLAQQVEPALHDSYGKVTIRCRLHSGATVSSLGQGSRCTFLYKYEPIERGEDPVKITVANLVHSCPDGIRKARFRALDLGFGQNYTRLKVFAAELSYGVQPQGWPGEVKPALGNQEGVDAANPSTSCSSASQVDKAREPKPVTKKTHPKEPKPSTATRDKDDKLEPAVDAEKPSTSAAPQVVKPGQSASVEPGPSTSTVAATATVGVPPPRSDPAPPPRAVTTPPPPGQASEAGPSLPAGAAAAAADFALSPDTKLVDHRRSRSSEDPPPYSVQPAVENEPPRKRTRLTTPTGFAWDAGDEYDSLLESIDARRRTRGAGSSLGPLQGRRATSDDHQFAFHDTKTPQRDSQASTSALFNDGTSNPVREDPVSHGVHLGPIRSFRRNAQQHVMPPPPRPPPMTSLLAAHGFDAEQRLSVELALREIGIRSVHDLTTFVLLEDETVEAMARRLGTLNIERALPFSRAGGGKLVGADSCGDGSFSTLAPTKLLPLDLRQESVARAMSSDTVNLPKPILGATYDSVLTFKIAVFAHFLNERAEPVIVGSEPLIRCRLRSDSTLDKIGKGKTCQYSIRARRTGPDGAVCVTETNTSHSCPASVRHARNSTDSSVGPVYARTKMEGFVRRFQAEDWRGLQAAEAHEAEGETSAGSSSPSLSLYPNGRPIQTGAQDTHHAFVPSSRSLHPSPAGTGPSASSSKRSVHDAPVERAAPKRPRLSSPASTAATPSRIISPHTPSLTDLTATGHFSSNSGALDPAPLPPKPPRTGNPSTVFSQEKHTSLASTPFARPLTTSNSTQSRPISQFLSTTSLLPVQRDVLARALESAGVLEAEDLVKVLFFHDNISTAFRANLLVGRAVSWPADSRFRTIGEALKAVIEGSRVEAKLGKSS